MIRKGMKLYSILFGACPKCHLESMYTVKNPYVLSDTLKINEKCSHCSTKYRMEPSFFYGSMYVSYGVGVAFAVAAFITSFVIFESSILLAFISIVLTLIGFMPIIMRLSRNIWINLFMSYDKALARKAKNAASNNVNA
ncbi:DUF983 domain-containing protein [Winogradskyella flava]|uniref:DUF983 domain-containing protein n=1 Tax=Winogradskyella flava TaxID=1884876 RepID=A0A842INM9_9FLAO|nr:DUF983 domain-containing protein [Winogradskyella flava]MBC2844610.1 DUF983 domain-containing protein [Winogradskyella flava]